jgi:hypothetical protein
MNTLDNLTWQGGCDRLTVVDMRPWLWQHHMFSRFTGTSFEHRKLHALHTWSETSGMTYQVSKEKHEKLNPKYQAYSALENHICWNDPRDARMLPPIQTLHNKFPKISHTVMHSNGSRSNG